MFQSKFGARRSRNFHPIEQPADTAEICRPMLWLVSPREGHAPTSVSMLTRAGGRAEPSRATDWPLGHSMRDERSAAVGAPHVRSRRTNFANRPLEINWTCANECARVSVRALACALANQSTDWRSSLAAASFRVANGRRRNHRAGESIILLPASKLTHHLPRRRRRRLLIV